MEFDEIGKWSEIKLEIVGKYADSYAKILSKQRLNFYYIDAFCGAGVHIERNTQKGGLGSPLRVLTETKGAFNRYYFSDADEEKTAYLRQICQAHHAGEKCVVQTGDCNQVLADLMPQFSYEKYERLLCLLDPYGLHLDWETIKRMGASDEKKGITDLILNFPVMDMNRNVIWRDINKVRKPEVERMTRFWGDESWRNAAYCGNLFGDPDKQGNADIVAAFRARLCKVAGFKHVPPPIPMKNTKGTTVYYLFFASQNETAAKIASYLLKQLGG